MGFVARKVEVGEVCKPSCERVCRNPAVSIVVDVTPQIGCFFVAEGWRWDFSGISGCFVCIRSSQVDNKF